ncbi:MAG: IS110 family transposase [Firmicutes bacterium]|nr:IS110 family transposase [Bacillota bacterium]
MRIVHRICCGLDVHKDEITACLISKRERIIKTFGTMTEDLLALLDWLLKADCMHVAMESTGVYWKPVYNILEAGGLQEILVVNARDVKAVPGRKTDITDAEWIADLYRHGLLRGSFIPDRAQRELRELVRYRRSLIEEHSREVNRIQKVLEGANIKLGSVATDVNGKSGRAIIEALIKGETSVEAMADLAKGRLRNKMDLLKKSLNGLIGPHQRMLLEAQRRHIDFLEEEIERLSKEIEARMRPFDEAIERLDEVPGLGRISAEQVLCVIGLDMSRFPSSKHIASWVGLCPGNNESAGKRKSGKTRHGNQMVKTTLIQAAQSIAHTRGNYLSAMYHRLAARKGAKKAAVAVAHALLVIIYRMLKDGTRYKDLGGNFFDELNKQAVVKRTVKRLEALGYKVTVEPTAPAA